jgi:prepilin-type N-terminal cleavage/methylation domain-containing protein
MKIKNNKKGFTLIELMVVIAIIGFMSSVILASLTATRVKARDTQRISELRNIEKALHLYAMNNNGFFPTSSYRSWIDVAKTPNFVGQSSATICGAGNLAVQSMYDSLISSKALPSKPKTDPMASKGYCYLYISDATGRYAVLATALEGKKNIDQTQSVAGVTFGSIEQDWVNINLSTGKNILTTSPMYAPI